MAALGERFRAAREARGLSLSDVAEQIRIRSVYLGAIEDENWTAIGAPVYTRGFLRTYARFLGLDPEEVVGEFNRATASGPAPSPASTPPPSSSMARLHETRPRNLSPLIWIASLVAVALVAFVFYNEVTLHARQVEATAALPSNTSAAPSPGVTDGSPLPGASATFVPSPSPSPQSKTLELRVSQASWIRVAVDGSVSMEGTFPAGTARVFHGKNAVVRIGNAGGVDVFVDGRDLGKLGAVGDVVERSFTL
jgi:cytoskeleton protein RodZ